VKKVYSVYTPEGTEQVWIFRMNDLISGVRGPVREKPRARGPGVFSLTPRRTRPPKGGLHLL